MHLINDTIIVRAAWPLASIAHLPCLEDVEVVVVIHWLDNLLGMTDVHLDPFCQGVQGLIHQSTEELNILEHFPVGFLEEFLPEAMRQPIHKQLLLLQTEFLLNVDGLINVIVDPPGQRLWEVVFAGQFLEHFEVFAFLKVLLADVADKGTNAVDIVGKADTADSLNEDETKCLLVCGCNNVSKPHCEHDSSAPIIRPYILLIPRRAVNAFGDHPIAFNVDICHGSQKNSQHMRKTKVKQKNL